MIYEDILKKEKKIAVIGLGYVGLPIALAFAKKGPVVGFDINDARVKLMQQNIDPSNELEATDFEGADIVFTSQLEDLQSCSFYIVAVPTPIDQHYMPNLRPLLGATETVGKVLSPGDYVVFESTVYPGCTEEDCVPLLEKYSGLKGFTDFKVGYSPERINPGDKEHTITKITKVVSGNDAEALDNIAKVYELIIEAGVYRAASIKVAEAAKIIENTQRDLNIALMNELSQIFNKLGINTYDVLEAAGTKWNFLKFQPGLVGGHCIGVDPYYLTYKAGEIGFHPKVILSGRGINDGMGSYVARETIQQMARQNINIGKAKVLVMGATFKENVADIRNSKVADVVHELKKYSIDVTIHDPHASAEEFKEEYGLPLTSTIGQGYDAVVAAVSHQEYLNMSVNDFRKMMNANSLLVDIKGKFRAMAQHFPYWSL